MLLEVFNSYRNELLILAWLSLGLFVISVAVIPFVIIKIPKDYFLQEYRTRAIKKSAYPILAQFFTGIKNLAGFIFIILGIFMLILPGQGILTVLMGLFLMNFPGKYKLERKLVSIPKVLKSLNWIRSKAKKPKLMIE
jgi:uncharacterized membrane protein